MARSKNSVNTARFLAKGGPDAAVANPGGAKPAGNVSMKSPVNVNMPTSKRPPAGKTVSGVSSKATVGKFGAAGVGMLGKPVMKDIAGGKRSTNGVKSR